MAREHGNGTPRRVACTGSHGIAGGSTTPRGALRALAVAGVLATLLAGCASRRGGASGPDMTGEYRLLSIDGRAVPCFLSHQGMWMTIRGGAFRISDDGTCGSRMDVVAPNGRDVTVERCATYTRSGAKIAMRWQGFGETTGTLDGDVFSMDNEGNVYAYLRTSR